MNPQQSQHHPSNGDGANNSQPRYSPHGYQQQQQQEPLHAPMSDFLPGGQFAMPLSAVAATDAPAASSSVPWCSVQYYEFKTKVGESFHATSDAFTIDGYCTCPTTAGVQAFSLGTLNNVNRCPEVESIRRYIGWGVRVSRGSSDAGEVFLTNLSNSPVFVQAPCVNYDSNPAVIMRVERGRENLLVFSLRSFQDRVQRLRRQRTPVEALTQAQALCSIRLSFVKGWGQNYQLQCIMSTPCHCELIFNEAYRELDRDLINPVLDGGLPSSMS